MTKKIIWIASWPKSGNTWFRSLLTSYIRGECHINRLYGMSERNQYFMQVVSPKGIDDLSEIEQVALRPSMLLHMSHWMTKSHPDTSLRMFVKTHCANINIQGIPLIPKMVSHAAVVIVRDPRDVVVSLINHTEKDAFHCTDRLFREDNVLNMRPFAWPSSWNTFYKSWMYKDVNLGPCPYILIRYEDLFNETALTFRTVLEFLNMEIDKDRIHRAVEQTSFERLKKQEEESGFDEFKGRQTKFFRRGIIGSYKDELNPKCCELIEKNCEDIMKIFKYIT